MNLIKFPFKNVYQGILLKRKNTIIKHSHQKKKNRIQDLPESEKLFSLYQLVERQSLLFVK